MNKRKFYACIFLLSLLRANAQDPLFTNTAQSLIYLNPSFAGSNGGFRTQSLFRAELPLQNSTYKTLYNSVDFYLKAIGAGMAFSHVYDNAYGKRYRSQGTSFSYAQYLSMADGALKIIPSLQVSYTVKYINRGELHFGDAIDPRHGGGWTTFEAAPVNEKKYVDLSSGLLIKYNRAYIGASVFHINKPNIGLLGDRVLQPRWNLYASVNYLKDYWSYGNLSLRYEHQGTYDLVQVMATRMLRRFFYAVGYNFKKTVYANLGYRNNFFTLSLGYETLLPIRNRQASDTWEAKFTFNLRNKEQRKSLVDLEAQ